MRKLEKVIVHCSASSFGDAEQIDTWHKVRGWKGIGYHYVILNGTRRGVYIDADDGKLEMGRGIEEVGAHCKGENRDSIGICLIGERLFSVRQLRTLAELCLGMESEWSIPIPEYVFCHHTFNPAKSCPNINQGDLRRIIWAYR